jgi:bifunctional non-homologous end joining protein LigD
MPLGRRAEPFDDPEWLFELKYDGFRALAYVEFGRCTLYSRNGHPFASFHDLDLQIGLIPRSAVIDGEIVCLDKRGKPQFYELMSRRGKPCFIAFDLLSSNGKDLRHERLLDRKNELRRMISGAVSVIYADHLSQNGTALFEKACELDLEGIVAKHQHSPYMWEENYSPWIKIRNPQYSQWEGRHELFERERRSEPAPGWHRCDLACEEAEAL